MAQKTLVAVDTIIAEHHLLLVALSTLTSENDRLLALTTDLETSGKLNTNGLFRADGSGKVVYANKVWFEITGIAALGPESDRWIERVHVDDRAGVQADWDTALTHAGTTFDRVARFVRPDGDVAAVSIHGVSLPQLDHGDRDHALAAVPAHALGPVRVVVGVFAVEAHARPGRLRAQGHAADHSGVPDAPTVGAAQPDRSLQPVRADEEERRYRAGLVQGRRAEEATYQVKLQAGRTAESELHRVSLARERTAENSAYHSHIDRERSDEVQSYDVGLRRDRAESADKYQAALRDERGAENAAHKFGLDHMRADELDAYRARLESERAAETAAHRDEILRVRAEEMEAHRREQERFVDLVCHEIRNPLNGIVHSLGQLIDGRARLRGQLRVTVEEGDSVPASTLQAVLRQLDDEEGMLSAIDLCAFQQRRITDDILHISRLRLGQQTHDVAPFLVDAVLQDAAQAVRAEAFTGRISVDVSPGTGEPYVVGDRLNVTQIAVNILSSALPIARAAVRTSIRLSAATTTDASDTADPGHQLLEVTVAIPGVVLSTDDVAALLSPPPSASDGSTRRGRPGLGLAVTRQLLELMGGSLQATSTAASGTTITAHVPLHPGVSTAPRLERTLVPEGNKNQPGEPKRPTPVQSPQLQPTSGAVIGILVVDDNEVNRKVLMRQLQTVPGAVYAPTSAVNGEEAVHAVMRDRVQTLRLVFMDVEMPVMNGLVATRLLRAHEHAMQRPRMPIVGVSGNARQEQIDEAMASGMDAYLVKPYDRAAMLELVARLLKVDGSS